MKINNSKSLTIILVNLIQKCCLTTSKALRQKSSTSLKKEDYWNGYMLPTSMSIS